MWTVIHRGATVQPISREEWWQAMTLIAVLAGVLAFCGWVLRGERQKSKYDL